MYRVKLIFPRSVFSFDGVSDLILVFYLADIRQNRLNENEKWTAIIQAKCLTHVKYTVNIVLLLIDAG